MTTLLCISRYKLRIEMTTLQRLIFTTMTISALSLQGAFSDTLPNKIIYATHDQDWYPIDYKNDDGDYVGVFEDIFIELFVNELGLDVDVIRQPWNRSQMDVRNGDADFLITVPTEDRQTYTATVPTPYFTIEFHLLVPRTHPKFATISAIKTVDDILKADITLVSTFGNGWYESTMKAAGVKTEYVKTDEQQIKFLLAGRADALVDFPLTMEPLLEKLDAKQQLVFTDAIFSKTNLHILVGKNSVWSNHLDIIDSALIKIQQDPIFPVSPFK